MKVLKCYPPNYGLLVKAFPIKGKQGLLFAWGDRIFNPSGITIPEQLKAHELVHGVRQVEFGVHDWWDIYIHDEQFRLNEEVLAHRAEWREYQALVTRQADLDAYLQSMVRRISGPLYGNMITEKAALQEITS